jgi:hypothetical protein
MKREFVINYIVSLVFAMIGMILLAFPYGHGELWSWIELIWWIGGTLAMILIRLGEQSRLARLLGILSGMALGALYFLIVKPPEFLC